MGHQSITVVERGSYTLINRSDLFIVKKITLKQRLINLSMK